MKGYGLIILLFILIIFVCLLSAYYGPNIIEIFTSETKKYNKRMIVTKDKAFNPNTDKIRVNMGRGKNILMSIEITNVVVKNGRVEIDYTMNDCINSKKSIMNKNNVIHKFSTEGDAFVSLVTAKDIPSLCSAEDMGASFYILKENNKGELITTNTTDAKTIRFEIRNGTNVSKEERSITAENLQEICKFLTEKSIKHTGCPSKDKAVRKSR